MFDYARKEDTLYLPVHGTFCFMPFCSENFRKYLSPFSVMTSSRFIYKYAYARSKISSEDHEVIQCKILNFHELQMLYYL